MSEGIQHAEVPLGQRSVSVIPTKDRPPPSRIGWKSQGSLVAMTTPKGSYDGGGASSI